jgi:hypothetical protein
LLWVLPLGLYLLSFVSRFAEGRKARTTITLLAPVIILIAGGLAFTSGTRDPFFSATLGLLLCSSAGGRRCTPSCSGCGPRRPPHAFLSGDVVRRHAGRLFCAIVAPLVFDWAYEHPLLILAAAFLVPQVALLPWPRRHITLLTFALPVLALLLSFAVERFATGWWSTGGIILISLLVLACLGRPVAFASSLAALMLSYGGWTILQQSTTDIRTRSYFGIYQVNTFTDDAGQPYETRLTHGTTLHGVQNMVPGTETVPTSYYARRSAVGEALAHAPAMFGQDAGIGVVGLGSGTLSCYKLPGRAGASSRSIPRWWRSPAPASASSGIARRTPGSSWATRGCGWRSSRPIRSTSWRSMPSPPTRCPMHLLTREALAVYGNAVQPDGIVLFHISNRYLDLKPVIADLAETGGWQSAMVDYLPTSRSSRRLDQFGVDRALSQPATMQRLMQLSGEDAEWLRARRARGFPGGATIMLRSSRS